MLRDWISVDRERSAARIADIELGLTGPDASLWRERARDRIRVLLADRMDFGLVAHEQVELDRLTDLVGKPIDAMDVVAAVVGFCLCLGLLVACSLWSPA